MKNILILLSAIVGIVSASCSCAGKPSPITDGGLNSAEPYIAPVK